MDLREAEKRVGVSNEKSERGFVVDFLHELDHLAHGFVPTEGSNPSVAERIENERKTWAETCEHTIRPLLETHRLTIAPRHFSAYKAWLSAGRDANNATWRSFIERECKPLLR